ncbi:MAG: hypothetical protein AB1894_04645 [Chloroflexota bacterium]
MNQLKRVSTDFESWGQLLQNHLERYPAMTARDIYKLLYQGILGPEHLMPSADIFIARLEDELSGLQPDAGEALLEAIRPDGALQRIHLRPWLASGQDVAQLAQACLEAGRRAWGDKLELRRIWVWFLDQVEDGRFPMIAVPEARKLDNWLQEDNFPAAHHSSSYVSNYRPAYRLTGVQSKDNEHATR